MTETKKQWSWAIVGGSVLVFLSAAVNSCLFVNLGTSVSHLQGDLTKVASHTINASPLLTREVPYLITTTGCFVLGAVAAGFFIRHPPLDFKRPYGRALLAIGVSFIGAHLSVISFPLLSIGIAGLACGFQNALATHYHGLLFRTAHITGLLTDLGTQVGMKLRGDDVPGWKIYAPLCLVSSFVLGVMFGSALMAVYSRSALLILATFYMAGGSCWMACKHIILPRWRRSLEQKEFSALGGDL
jgi:uncharacterized membrane protein YoaK (UPF0700 family)